jgi:hypothetical protein
MEKTIFILREVAWNFNDDWYSHAGATEVYQKFATYEEAHQEKMNLEIPRFKNRYYNRLEIIEELAKEGLTYENYTIKKLGIDHFNYMKEQTGIDYKGLLESDLLKDFEFKVFIGWQSVIHFCYLMRQISHDKKMKDLLADVSSYPNDIASCRFLLLTGESEFGDIYEYSKKHFGLDIKAILESPFFIQNETSKYWVVDEIGHPVEISHKTYFGDLFRIMVLSSEEHIKTMLQALKFDFYEIAEVGDDSFLYQVYTTPSHDDFISSHLLEHFKKDGYVFTAYPAQGTYEEGVISHTNFIEAQNELCTEFYNLLAQSGRTLKGALSDLSEAPEMLKSYIESYTDYFVYDAENQQLSMNHIHDKEKMYEVMRGFVALLRSEKVPFIIKFFPIAEIPEKYIKVERRQEEERQKTESRRQENSEEDAGLPF